jgi:hypothetical protein
MAKVEFATVNGGQNIGIAQEHEYAGNPGAFDARTYIEESPNPKASRDDWAECDRALNQLNAAEHQMLRFYCDKGLFRSPTAAGIYMMKFLGYDPAGAVKELNVNFVRVHGNWGNATRVQEWLESFWTLSMGRPRSKRGSVKLTKSGGGQK